jgi:hypothetical protein
MELTLDGMSLMLDGEGDFVERSAENIGGNSEIRGTMLENNITNNSILNHQIRPESGQPQGGR